MAIADKLNELITQRNNLADNLNTMGVDANKDEKLSTLVPKVLDIQTGGSEITKGFIINEFNNEGWPLDISVVGFERLPGYYFHYTMYWNGNTSNLLSHLNADGFHFPQNLKEIGTGCFQKCWTFKVSELPDTLETIQDYAFQECKQLNLNKLPDSVKKIGSRAFQGCEILALKTLSPRLTNISDYCFLSCKKLALESLPEALETIGSQSFADCYEMTISELPNTITSLGMRAFDYCKKITIDKIPDKVTKLDNYVFRGCIAITNMDILSENFTSIGTGCFQNCTALEKLILRTTTPPTLNSNALAGTLIASGTGYIYVPDESISAYQSATNWSTYAAQIKPISELEG